MGRYAVFIDGGYIKCVLAEFGNQKVDYLKFSEYVANEQERLRTYYYDCAPYTSSPPRDEEKARKQAFDRFAFALDRQSRFQVRLGRLAGLGGLRFLPRPRVARLIGGRGGPISTSRRAERG